jgi:hypothetical protein
MPTAQVAEAQAKDAAYGSPASACQLDFNALEKLVAAAAKPGDAGGREQGEFVKFPLLAGEYKAGTFDYMLRWERNDLTRRGGQSSSSGERMRRTAQRCAARRCPCLTAATARLQRAPPAPPPARSEGVVTTREWLHVFRKSVPAYRRAAAADPAVPEASRPAAVAAFVRAFEGVLDALERDPTLGEVDGFVTAPLSCATLCRVR